jgi:hypothetical protein
LRNGRNLNNTRSEQHEKRDRKHEITGKESGGHEETTELFS